LALSVEFYLSEQSGQAVIMEYDLALEIKAPVERVFHLVLNWHVVPELRSRAGVREFTRLGGNHYRDYYQIAVRDLPLLTTWCYGKRLSKPPTTLVNMFVYRFFKSPSLQQPEGIEEVIEHRWDSFFYQTIRLQPLPENTTRLYFLDSFGLDNSRKRAAFNAYFSCMQKLAETNIIATGVDVIAEPADDELFPEDEDAAVDEGGYETRERFTYDIYDDYDPWRVLGLAPGASLDTVKTAYRNLAREHHPDRQDRGADYGHNQFVEITAAYHAILRDLG